MPIVVKISIYRILYKLVLININLVENIANIVQSFKIYSECLKFTFKSLTQTHSVH